MPPSRTLRAAVSTSIPLFLAPAFASRTSTSTTTSSSAVRLFTSTTCQHGKRKGDRDGNRQRGVSAIRSTGPRQALSIDRLYPELPKPRPEHERSLEEFPTPQNHGLYGFFNKARDTVVPGEKEQQHGRTWSNSQLCFKSFADLHALYWQCVLESNRISTRILEHSRLRLGYGRVEAKGRLSTVRGTQRNIRRVLRDRAEAYEQAQLIRDQPQQSLSHLLNPSPIEAEYQDNQPRDVDTMVSAVDSGAGRHMPETEPDPTSSRRGQHVIGPRPSN